MLCDAIDERWKTIQKSYLTRHHYHRNTKNLKLKSINSNYSQSHKKKEKTQTDSNANGECPQSLKAKTRDPSNKKPELRNTLIVPEITSSINDVYTGRDFGQDEIKSGMISRYLAELPSKYKPVKQCRPGGVGGYPIVTQVKRFSPISLLT
uniref:40S ribosomal protein S15 n=1 Tax=Glossina morsitans morsitans TaxID=37546 RepID=A0A1B0FHE8_GLOMM